MNFRFERLPNLCYWCGRLTHDDKDCSVWIDSEGSLINDQKQFGPSLRAPPFLSSQKNMVSVPGFHKSKSNRVLTATWVDIE